MVISGGQYARVPAINAHICYDWYSRLCASEYLQGLHQRDHMAFIGLWHKSWPEILHQLSTCLIEPESLAPLELKQHSLEDLSTQLRRQKRLLVMVLAALDYGGFADGQSDNLADASPTWQDMTKSLSDFAALALRVLLEACMRAHGFADDTGITVLGMGKLGGEELNYSSDIDLIILYDCLALRTDLVLSARPAKIMRAVRQCVQCLEQVNREGYIFRVDLRLRPDPLSTPPAIEIAAAIRYYESAGLAWERAAMIKARPIAGDIALGEYFLCAIEGFLWRRHLDYASIEDISHIQQRALQPFAPQFNADGINVKLVEGGIRDIELFAQSYQLVWGGRNAALRIKPTCEVLQALVAHQHIAKQAADQLQQAYALYRRLEHALQLLQDHQRHHLPDNNEEWQRVATLMNRPVAAICQQFLETRALVREICHPPDSAPTGLSSADAAFDTSLEPIDVLLRRSGFDDVAAAEHVVARWLGGGYRVTALDRSRRLLQQLLPALLSAIAHTHHPHDALMRMDRFLEALPAGTQLFSLFAASPGLLRHCADIMGNAPRLAEWLARKPSLFEYLLNDYNSNVALEYLSPLEEPVRFEQTLDECRRLAYESEFRCSVAFIAGRLSLQQLQHETSTTADKIIVHSLQRLRQQQPRLPQQGLAILALGKLGRHRLIPMSDLDMILVYDAPKVGEVAQAYVKLAQRLVSALSVPTAEGSLYEVDLRLRPHGDAGALICSMEMLRGYYAQEAWIWEHFALSQARVLYADSAMVPLMNQWLYQEQTRHHQPATLRAAIRDMQKRIGKAFAQEHLWSIKHHHGGLMDCAFARQYLLLVLANAYPNLPTASMVERCDIAVQHGLIDAAQSQALQRHTALLFSLEAGMRVTSGQMNGYQQGQAITLFDPTRAPPGQVRLLCRLAKVDSLSALEQCLRTAYSDITALCQHLFDSV